MGQLAEESAKMAACLANLDSPGFTAPFMDQRIPIGADIVRAVAPILGDRALGGEGVDQVAHAGAGGPVERELPNLSQPGLELREPTDDEGGLQVLPEVLIIPVLEALFHERGRVGTAAFFQALSRGHSDP